MYVVKTYLDKSTIHGVGVFAGEDIPKGTVVWKLTKEVDRVWSREDVAALPEEAQTFIRRHGWVWRGKVYMSGDDGMMTNHSDDPNTITAVERETEIASRDIKKGEELTCNYRDFDEDLDEEELKRNI